MDLNKVATKLTAARTKLILDKPFLGALVLRLPMTAADKNWCPTTATDARRFYYNAEYIESLSMSQTQFMLAHEALHCALSHFARRQHRAHHRWDLACDYAINPLLIEDGLSAPPNMQFMPAYLGMTAEEIYPLLDDNDQSETLDRHMYDQDNEAGGGQQGELPKDNSDSEPDSKQDKNKTKKPPPASDNSSGKQQASGDTGQQSSSTEKDTQASSQPSQDEDVSTSKHENGELETESADEKNVPPPLSNEEKETLDVQWQQRLAGAAQQAMQAGKLGGSIGRLMDHLLQPQLPWRMLLARYMTSMARDDFSYMRPSRREGDAILPSLKSSQIDIAIAIDTSGSVKSHEMDEFISEVAALKGQMRARVTLIPCDAEISNDGPWFFEPWDDFSCPTQITGGGSTDFRPVFNWIDQQSMKPELLVYFTDGEGSFPKQEPNYPVIWLVKGKHKVPWGQRVQLN